jgi:hypothetical protein
MNYEFSNEEKQAMFSMQVTKKFQIHCNPNYKDKSIIYEISGEVEGDKRLPPAFPS